ncbi:MAG: hypothetical protein H6611_05035 [Ignavibacteriales bacterium]|nr:hypothetical protein [Ignavibacteriales bacterium]
MEQVAGFNHSNWLADGDYDYAAGSINVDGLGTTFPPHFHPYEFLKMMENN